MALQCRLICDVSTRVPMVGVNMIHGSVKRWGNSPAVRIPAALMKALNLNIDDEVKIDLVEGKLVIEPVKKEPAFSLAELVEGITADNLHDLVDWGKPVDKD